MKISSPTEKKIYIFAASIPCYEDGIKLKRASLMSLLVYGKTGIRTLEAVLALTRFPVVRLRPTQPSFHSCLPMLLFKCGCSIPYFLEKIKSFYKKIYKNDILTFSSQDLCDFKHFFMKTIVTVICLLKNSHLSRIIKSSAKKGKV